ncbi:MAG: hypothetical protein ACT4O0_07615 [Pseudonocardia sp.]|jgi:hypothetical protein
MDLPAAASNVVDKAVTGSLADLRRMPRSRHLDEFLHAHPPRP